MQKAMPVVITAFLFSVSCMPDGISRQLTAEEVELIKYQLCLMYGKCGSSSTDTRSIRLEDCLGFQPEERTLAIRMGCPPWAIPY